MTHIADNDDVKTMCPSAPPEPGSVLLGIVVEEGHVAYLHPNLPVTDDMLQALDKNGIPKDNRMRFSCSCMKEKCVQWQDTSNFGRCGLIDHAVTVLYQDEKLDQLPHCGIRQHCRWFFQHRLAACSVCPEIVRRPYRNCKSVCK